MLYFKLPKTTLLNNQSEYAQARTIVDPKNIEIIWLEIKTPNKTTFHLQNY